MALALELGQVSPPEVYLLAAFQKVTWY
jgi:hypothetical protein